MGREEEEGEPEAEEEEEGVDLKAQDRSQRFGKTGAKHTHTHTHTSIRPQKRTRRYASNAGNLPGLGPIACRDKISCAGNPPHFDNNPWGARISRIVGILKILNMRSQFSSQYSQH
jgi:hypothetical protein